MAEQAEVETQTSQEEPEETLESALKDFPVEEMAKSFTATPEKKQMEKPDVNIPDPSYDPEGFKKAVGKFAENDWEIGQKVDQVLNAVEEMKQERIRNVEQTDLTNTVKDIQDAIPALKGKDHIVQGLLGAYANKDQRIAKAWEQRRSNPAAWNKVSNALKKEIAREFDFQSDPQLTENVKAARASRDQMATTRRPDKDEEWQGLETPDFQHKWDRLVRGH